MSAPSQLVDQAVGAKRRLRAPGAPLSQRFWPLGLALALVSSLPPLTAGCGDEGLTLPPSYNTGRNRLIEIRANLPTPAPTNVVRALNGVDGAPNAVVPGDPDLIASYWGRALSRPSCTSEFPYCPPGLQCQPTAAGFECRGQPCVQGQGENAELLCGEGLQCVCLDPCVQCVNGCQPSALECHPPDGAHVNMVRLGAHSTCALSLDHIFQGGDPEDPASYDFNTLDAHARVAATRLNTADVIWQAAFKPEGSCTGVDGNPESTPLLTAAEGEQWAQVAFNTLRHLREGNNNSERWDQVASQGLSRVRLVEFMADPIVRLGYPQDTSDSAYNLLFTTYEALATQIKERWPDVAGEPAVYIGGMSFELSSKDELEQVPLHPVIEFIAFCQENAVPLDFLSFRTRTARAYDAGQIASKLRTLLDSQGFGATRLINTGIDIAYDAPELATSRCAPAVLGSPNNAQYCSAFLGAFQTAARIFMQDAPVEWSVAGRGPRVFDDLQPRSETDVAAPIIPSDYFDLSGIPQPAFMAMFPFRQIAGHSRVTVDPDASDSVSMAVLASHPSSSRDQLHIIVANANLSEGKADLTYDIRVDGFVPPTMGQVDYKLAVLDRNSSGTASFFFSELGVLETSEGTGTIRFVHQMAVPSIHYIQLSLPK